MNHKTDMQAALQACVDAMLHDGVPTDPYHPRRVALAAAENALASRPDAQADERGAFQSRVHPWMLACFGSAIAADTVERNHRFFEEASELVQACGMTASEAHQLVDYTWGRPVGEKSQEVGGVMVTLAALCLANGLDMHAAGEVELARISAPEMMAKIRAKQAAKPKHSPLPEARAAEPRAVGTQKTPTLVNLEGLRERLLAPREIVRDEDGWLTHPEYPVCDEDVRADKLLEAFRIESAFVSMEDDVSHEAYEEYYESGAPDCSSWTPTPPAGNDWRLLEIYDTEDGPYAMFARDAYTAEQERKKENTRKLRAAVDAARAERFAAPSPDREQVGEAAECCDTPSYCSSVRRCTAHDASPSRECGEPPAPISEPAQLPAENAAVRNKIAAALHYPEHWDDTAYPTLDHAAWEAIATSKLACSECVEQPSERGEQGADMRKALQWVAGTLQTIVSGRWRDVKEGDRVSIGAIVKTIADVLDMADAALAAKTTQQECPHGVDDGACKQCYGEATSGEQGAALLHAAADECMSPAQRNLFDSLGAHDADVYKRLFGCVAKRIAPSAPTLGAATCAHEWKLRNRFGEGNSPWVCANCGIAEGDLQPQAAEPKGMTEAIEALQCPETHSCSNPELFERGWEIGRDAALDIVRALLAKGE